MAIRSNNFGDFFELLDLMHGAVHCEIDGTMCERHNFRNQVTFLAANAPEFFNHHSNVDKLWYYWQRQSSAHANAYFSGQGGRTLPSSGGRVVNDYLDSHGMRGVCVQYVEASPPGSQGRVTVDCPVPWKEYALKWTATGEESASRKGDRLEELLCSQEAQGRMPPGNLTAP